MAGSHARTAHYRPLLFPLQTKQFLERRGEFPGCLPVFAGIQVFRKRHIPGTGDVACYRVNWLLDSQETGCFPGVDKSVRRICYPVKRDLIRF